MEKKTRKVKVSKVAEPAVIVEPSVVSPTVAEAAPIKKNKESENTYILLFRMEGHTAYRLMALKTKDLEFHLRNAKPKHPPMLDKKWFVFDRINGTITLEN